MPEGFATEGGLLERIGVADSCWWDRPDPHEVVAGRLAAMVAVARRLGVRASSSPAPATSLPPRVTVVSLGVDVTADEVRAMRPMLDDDSIVIAHAVDANPGRTCIPTDGWSVGADAARHVAGALDARLAGHIVDRLVELTHGRQPVIGGALRASLQLGAATCTQAIEHSVSANELMARIIAELITAASNARLHALILSARLGYAHAALGAVAAALEQPDEDPWWEPLECGWYRMHPIWRRALLAVPIPRSALFTGQFARLVGELESNGLPLEAINVCASVTPAPLADHLIDDLAAMAHDYADDGAFAHWLAIQPPSIVARMPALRRINAELSPEPTRTEPGGLAMAMRAIARGRLQEAELWARHELHRGDGGRPSEQLRRLVRMIRRARRTSRLERRVLRALALTARLGEAPVAATPEQEVYDRGARAERGGHRGDLWLLRIRLVWLGAGETAGGVAEGARRRLDHVVADRRSGWCPSPGGTGRTGRCSTRTPVGLSASSSAQSSLRLRSSRSLTLSSEADLVCRVSRCRRGLWTISRCDDLPGR